MTYADCIETQKLEIGQLTILWEIVVGHRSWGAGKPSKNLLQPAK
jgi:hypothetical protein